MIGISMRKEMVASREFMLIMELVTLM